MTPLVFVSGILLGTAFSIFFGLAVVALLMGLLGSETPRVAAEIRPLLTYSFIFLGLTITSALGFAGLVKKHARRWWAQSVMWASWITAVMMLLVNR